MLQAEHLGIQEGEKESLRSCGEEREGVKRSRKSWWLVVCFKPPGMKFPAAESWSRKPGIRGRPLLIPLGAVCSGTELVSRACRMRTW